MTDTQKLVEALQLIAGTDPIDAALDPQRAIRVARAALANDPQAARHEGDRSMFSAQLLAAYNKADVAPGDSALSLFEAGFEAGCAGLSATNEQNAKDAALLNRLLKDPGPLWSACYRQLGTAGGTMLAQPERIRAVINAAMQEAAK